MKKLLIAASLAAALMIAIPLFTVKNNTFGDIKKIFNSKKEVKSDALTEIVAYNFKEDYCDEGLKAITIILNSNYKAGDKLKRLNKKDFIKKYKNGANYYSKIEKTIKENNGKYITYKGKPARIPYCYISNGKCLIDYPYIRKTSSPWDLLSKDYTFDAKSNVSLNSINTLCKNGLSYKESLSRYLKNIKITASKRGGH